MANKDMTFCANTTCPFKDCERHLVNGPKIGMVSVAWLDGTCRRYIGWLVEGADNKEPVTCSECIYFDMGEHEFCIKSIVHEKWNGYRWDKEEHKLEYCSYGKRKEEQ